MSAPRDRRSLLKTGARMGAVAGGIVWARPAIHTVKLVAATGTAPPETTTSPTTNPQSTHIDFTGPLTSSQGGPNAAPDCPGYVLNVYGTAELSVLGHTDIFLAP